MENQLQKTFVDVPLFHLNTFEAVVLLPGIKDQKTRIDELNQILDWIHKYLSTDLRTHIWYKETFRLRLAFSGVSGPYLHGITHFGHCIDDEWLMVHILLKMSLAFRDAYIRVSDSDGDLLLIEAAEELPDWMDPDNTQNRTWLRDGKLLIIPPRYKGETPLSIDQALKFIETAAPASFDHYPALDDEALARARTPAPSTHHASIYVPRKVAGLLHAYPWVIALAVNQFETVGSEPQAFEREAAWLRHVNVDSDDTANDAGMVRCTAQLTRLVYAKYVLDESGPPPWFGAFVAGFEDVSYEESMLGTKITATLDLLLREHTARKEEESLAQLVADEDAEFARILGERDAAQMEAMPYTANMEKEALEDSLFYASLRERGLPRPVEDTNVARLYAQIKEPSAQEVAQWDSTVDGNEWMYEMEAKASKGAEGEEDAELKEKFEGLFGQVKDMIEEEEEEGYESDDASSSDSSSSCSSDEGDLGSERGKGKTKSEDKVLIDEDDFFEFFLKEALHLTPEQIAEYQETRQEQRETPSSTQGGGEEDFEFTEEDFDGLEQELRDHGILQGSPGGGEGKEEELTALAELLAKMGDPGSLGGPAGALFAQMGEASGARKKK